MKAIFGLALSGLLIAGLWFLFFRQSDEQKIQRVLDDFSELMALDSSQNPIAMAGQWAKLEKLLSPDIRVRFEVKPYPAAEFVSVASLKEKWLMARAFFKTAHINYRDIKITVLDRKAEVNLTVVVNGEDNQGQTLEQATEAKIELAKTADDDWHIAGVENIETVRFR